MQWYIYIVCCADNSLYTGITTNLDRRMKEHNEVGKGAKYTRSRQPVTLVYSKKVKNRSDATIRESALKKLSRQEKLRMIKKS